MQRKGDQEAAGTELFLLSHQDDELMVAPIIAAAARTGQPIAIFYLTDGGGGPASPAVRNSETTRALSDLGVEVARDVIFLGEQLGISDGRLYENMMAAHDQILARIPHLLPIARIYTHAWEGGNPDHDAANVLALGIADQLPTRPCVFQVPFYRSSRSGPMPFCTFAPLPQNGPVTLFLCGRLARLGALALIRRFPTQVPTFIRLAPGMLLDAIRRPGVPLQRASWARIQQRPMPEPLRYERIGWLKFEQMAPYFERYRVGVSTH